MPACFTLTRRTMPDSKPVSLNLIDEELCAHLGVPVHPTRYCREWYNLQGMALALGHNWAKIRTMFPDPDDLAVTDWLEANFTPDAWHER